MYSDIQRIIGNELFVTLFDKKFCLTLTNVALPNLIANEVALVKPLASMTGYITYMSYQYANTKGSTTAGTEFNSPFKLGLVDKNYTSRNVVEAKTAVASGGVVSGTLNWAPIVPNFVEFVIGADTYRDGGDGKIYKGRTVTTADSVDSWGNVTPAGTAVNAGIEGAGGTINYQTGAYSFTDSGLTEATAVLCNYVYDNEVVPQNDLPTIKGEMKGIALVAKTRRIAIYYNQIAQFQAKTDYNFDLATQLAEQAVGTLSAEIDTEVTDLIIDNATFKPSLTFNKTVPVGITKHEHYADFTEILELAKKEIYDVTRRFVPNYMICASDILPILAFIPEFKQASTGQINGPYFAGTLGTLKVFIVPRTDFAGKFVIGVNGNDYMTSAVVYAPYMPIIPSGEVTYADGLTSKGWATMYDLKVLNPLLLIKGQIVAE